MVDHGLSIEDEFDDGGIGVGGDGGRERDVQAAGGEGGAETRAASPEDRGIPRRRAEPIDEEAAVGRPVEGVEVEGGVAAVAFDGAAAPGSGGEDAGAGAVDGLGVDLHPAADVGQPFCLVGLDLAIRHGADVEEEVAALAGDIDECADEHLAGFGIGVGLVVSPVGVDGHAGLPVDTGEALGGNFLLGSAEVADGVGGLAEAGHAAAVDIDAVVDDDIGLEGAAEVVEGDAALVRPGGFPLTIEPHDADVAVVGEQFRDLGVEVGVEAVVVGARGGAVGLPRTPREVVGVVPVHDGVVPADHEAVFAAGVGHFLHDVALEGRGHDIEVGDL